jgi:mRNA-degrading endonuclease RelE of RelBE toxin-antitoxin system
VDGLLEYRIEYSPECEEHLHALTARDRVIVLTAVETHLVHQPDVETQNRKPLRPNPLAPWELRIGDLRVFYDFETEPEAVVHVHAVGIKDHGVLRIAGKAFKL